MLPTSGDLVVATAPVISQVYTSALQGDLSMATQLLSPCISVLLEGLQGESQDEVSIGSVPEPKT